MTGRLSALRARAGEAHSLLRNSVFMIATTAVNSLLGYGYWVVAARGYSTADVGLSTALIAAMTLASLGSNVGIGHVLVQRLPERRDDREWSVTVTTGLVLATLSGLAAGVVVAAALPAADSQFDVVLDNPWYGLALIAGVAAWSAATVVDFVFIAERQTDKMLVRNAVFAALKLPLLALPVVLGQESALAIFGSWLAATVLVTAGALYRLVPRLGPVFRPRLAGVRTEARALARWAAAHHLISVGGIAPMYVLPMLVATRLSVVDNGYFYVTWMVGGLFFMVSPAVAANLFAEGSHRPDAIHDRARSAARIIAALLVPAMAVFVLAGETIMSAFGPDYAREGTTLLMILVASAVPDAVTNIAVSVLRVRRRLGTAAALNVGMAVVAAVLTWVLLPGQGIEGAGWAWLIAQSAGAVLVGAGVLAGRLRRRGGDPSPHDDGPRVCVVGPGSRFLSGVSYHTHALVDALSRGPRVTAILLRPRRAARRRATALTAMAFPPHVPVVDGVRGPAGLGAWRAMRHLREERPDVVLMQWWEGAALGTLALLARAAVRRGSSVVLELHGAVDPAAARGPLSRWPTRWLARGVVARADAFVVHSEADRARLARAYDVGDRPVELIAPGPPTAQLAGGGRARRHAPAGVCNLLYFGTIRPDKGLQDLLAAFDSLDEEQAERLWLTVVGETVDGWRLPAERIAASRHRERITFVDRYVHDDEVAAFFGGADAVVLPYRRASTGGALHLAMGHGLPVVVTRVGALPEVAGGYEGGILVAPRDPAALREAILALPDLAGIRYGGAAGWERPRSRFETLFAQLVP